MLKILIIIIIGLMGQSTWANTCSEASLSQPISLLKAEYPAGYKVFQDNKEAFLANSWWGGDCKEKSYDNVVVAIHETVHHLSSDTYYTLKGEKIPYINEDKILQPTKVSSEFQKDRFSDIYLKPIPNSQSSATSFGVLLDELNAYTHGLHASNVMAKHDSTKQWRAGVLAMLSYVQSYINLADKTHAATIETLKKPNNLNSLKYIWQQASDTLKKSCEVNQSANEEDQYYLKKMCLESKEVSSLGTLGLEKACHDNCLALLKKPASHIKKDSIDNIKPHDHNHDHKHEHKNLMELVGIEGNQIVNQ